ncbi:uncharacterized protein LOC107275141 isoform X2 [Cephus cinctus]|uniref:Gamma-aminobutyric acid type B receptor subunit 2 n=1 Tax=Cephus cinctus TaxID=211228 RepID=A0AAJ7R7S0_CEPCN|nr:uncharacterized protein LOC107275141 isoform X2 [Cephus cinctus]
MRSHVHCAGRTKSPWRTDLRETHGFRIKLRPTPTPCDGTMEEAQRSVKMSRPGSILGLLIILAVFKLSQSNKCLTMREEVNPKRVIHLNGESLNIHFELSRRITQRLASWIMKIFLEEVLGYPGIAFIEKDDNFNVSETFARLSDRVKNVQRSIIPETMVNMELWIPPDEDTTPLLKQYDVKLCGSVTAPGHFGWFVPERLGKAEDTWLTFTRQESSSRFDVTNATLLNTIRNFSVDQANGSYYCKESFCQDGMYIPSRCQSLGGKDQPCALLLAAHADVTRFVKDQIDRLNLYVKVVWVGPNLANLVEYLTKEYLIRGDDEKSITILHWTPSSVIPNEKDYTSLLFPGSLNGNRDYTYELNRLVKLTWAKLESVAKFAYEAINRANFTQGMYEDLIDRYNRFPDRRLLPIENDHDFDKEMEESIACDWLKENLNYTLRYWVPDDEDKNTLYIGGIFPVTGTAYTAKSIMVAANLARKAINANETVLRDYNLMLHAKDGQCKTDMVMKSYIDYLVNVDYEKLVGILGPACSETVEPLVGVSKLYKTVIISYGAEGSTFTDRTKYPYFFRTIGENKQYKHVYLRLLQQLGWHRVAALTEDGQRYTEYISSMQDMLQENGITFIANFKFPREHESEDMSRYLQQLKENRAKIIIADVNDQVARQVMCEAYRLGMTAVQGYVWFLPLWLLPRWYDTDYYNQRGEQVVCTTEEMMNATNGYFGLTHAYFAADEEIMQEGITVRQWRDKYENICERNKELPSNYAGYTYDAMWTYGYAMDQLIKENQSYVFDLHSDHTVNRLTDIIRRTDFHGVSGWIKFLGGPSRFSEISVIQHVDNETRVVGNFRPNISEERNEIVGGELVLNMSAIVWLSQEMPDDGSEPPQKCVLSGLAELLDVSCEVAIVVANVIGFGVLGALLIIGFIIVKRKYDEKVRVHEKYMKSLGLDFLPSDTSGLDKWEIPRDRVVINRKLGEGAFGTVYGGEAFFPEKGWLAVAVKTLKVGSTTDEKLDFLSEVEVMKRFEHKNIIKLLAVCIKCEPVLTVMEFMLYGDLKTYLLARRHLVNDQNYEESDEISNKKLTAMAMDVARALSYLAQMKYVHRDVASRNCLVNAQRVVKLGDFGMTRPMYENDYYKFNRKGMLPVRWMAPESLGLGIFTPASDVWSYGVLLYEIITFGSFPFQGMSNNQVLTYVKAGNSLTVPRGIKPHLEGLIRSCWTVDHTKRPTAPEIVDFLATYPRILAPCLDVPLASVQLQHTDQINIQLPENLQKFSISLSKFKLTSTGVMPFEMPNPPLLDIENNDENGNTSRLLEGCSISEPESSRLLLPTTETPVKYVELQQNQNTQKHVPRYVNLHPGMANLISTSDRNTNAGSALQLEERRSILAEEREPNDVSML